MRLHLRVHVLVRARASSIQPCHHLSSVAPPIKMPCCSLDPCLALYLPKQAFCVAQKRATVSGREWEEALVIGAKGGGGSSPVVSDLWEHLLNIRRAGVLPKMLHFSLLSPALLAPITTTMTHLQSNPPQWPVFELFVDFFYLTFSQIPRDKSIPAFTFPYYLGAFRNVGVSVLATDAHGCSDTARP